MEKILVIDDEPQIIRALKVNMQARGYEMIAAPNAETGIALAADKHPDVIIVDLGLPDRDGLTVITSVRKWSNVPILVLSGRTDSKYKITALENGADDYITKPFSTQELLARIRAVLRRRAPEQVAESVTLGALSLDGASYRVTFAGQTLKMGPTEFKLLSFLMHHTERVHSRSQLLDKVWGDHVFIEERTVDVHVKRLREALGEAGSMIETVRGAGYRLTVNAHAT